MLIKADVTRAPPGVGANGLTSVRLLSIGTVGIKGRICPVPVGSDVSTFFDTTIITENPTESSNGRAVDLLTSGGDQSV